MMMHKFYYKIIDNSKTILSNGQVNILSAKLQWEEFEKAFLVIDSYFMYSKIKFNNQEINDKEEILMLKTSIIDD
jgi:hypothetical protein